MPVVPGAEPWSSDGNEVGILVLHGFTGSPKSMRPWAEALAAEGWTVRLPLLPGHGTTWQDMNLTTWEDWYAEVEKALRDLQSRCTTVFVMGLSMGGSLTLRLAEQHGDAIAGHRPRQPGRALRAARPAPAAAAAAVHRRRSPASPTTSPSPARTRAPTTRSR